MTASNFSSKLVLELILQTTLV